MVDYDEKISRKDCKAVYFFIVRQFIRMEENITVKNKLTRKMTLILFIPKYCWNLCASIIARELRRHFYAI